MARNKSFSAAGDLQFRKQEVNTEIKKQAEDQTAREYAEIDASLITYSPFNKGLDMDNIEEYVRSLKENGLIEPISVYALPDGKYEILSGHQRFEAWCKRLKNKRIRAVILPYPEDPIKRFILHTEANVMQRERDARFWSSRIEIAKSVLEQSGFTGNKADTVEKICGMLNLSRAQLYRFESFKKLIPELQELESKHYLSANTLYMAVSLDHIQQREVRRKVDELQDVKRKNLKGFEDDIEITREEFRSIVDDVKKEPALRLRRNNTAKDYSSRVSKAAISLFNIISKCRTEEERRQAKEQIEELRIKLDELERSLG